MPTLNWSQTSEVLETSEVFREINNWSQQRFWKPLRFFNKLFILEMDILPARTKANV